MSRLKNLYLRVFNGNCSVDEIVEFITLAARALKPAAAIDSKAVIFLIQSGLINRVMPNILESVEKNPDKVGFQVIKIWGRPEINGERRVLKVDAYENNSY